MSDSSSKRILGFSSITAVLAIVCGFLFAGCGHAGGPLDDPTTGNDAKLVERMQKMRVRAASVPGGVMEASDFASQVALLFSQGVAKRKSLEPSLVDEAARALDSAKDANPDSAADLLARKGEMLLAAERQEEGFAALQESIAARPNLRAFNLLMKNHAAHKQSADAEALCRKTLPGMRSDDSRYAVLDECLKCSGADKAEIGLRWAGSKEISFYKARRKELEARLAKQKK